MEIEQEIIGFNPDGEVIIRYTLFNKIGAKVTLINIGAAVVSIEIPNKKGVLQPMTLSYPSYKEYQNDSLLMGKCVGRYAGRIAKSKITIDDTTYKLSSNEGTTHLNGGVSSFGSKIWQARTEKEMVVFSYVSMANEEGYPSEFGVEVGYSFDDQCTLHVTVIGEGDGDTVVNIAPFIYFTPGDNANLTIHSSQYIPLTNKMLPKGGAASVEGTIYDFRTPKKIREQYDDYWTIDHHQPNILNDICTLKSPSLDTEITIRSTQPALYFSSCSSIEGCGYDIHGNELENNAALLLSPMAISENYNDRIVRVGQTYRHYTTYNFKN